jgi:hypothetical protein
LQNLSPFLLLVLLGDLLSIAHPGAVVGKIDAKGIVVKLQITRSVFII